MIRHTIRGRSADQIGRKLVRLLALCLTIVGCNDQSASRSQTAGTAKMLRLASAFRIGSVNGAQESLTRIGPILIGPDQQLIVTQTMDRQLRVCDRSGSLLRTIGGQGSGPGEFQSIQSIGLRRDTLYVTDNALGRLSYFLLDGTFVRSVQWTTDRTRIVGSGILGATVPQVLLPDGSGIVEPWFALPAKYVRTPPRRKFHVSIPIMRVHVSGEPADTIANAYRAVRTIPLRNDGQVYMIWSPFDDRTLVSLTSSPPGVAAAQSLTPNRFSVARIEADGDTAFKRIFDVPSVYTSDTVLECRLKELQRAFRRIYGEEISTSVLISALREANHIPATLPPVSDVVATQDGAIWIQLTVDCDTARWLVLSADGELTGSVSLPAQHTLAASLGSMAVSTFLDEFDVPNIEKHFVLTTDKRSN